MPKTIIQVPMDEELVKKLNKISKRQKKTRAELIRQACEKFLKEKEREEQDRIYVEGYRRIPETTEWAEAQEKMLNDVWPREKW
jgi:metal-responsive CopG/Arc/MetJ family transcriptional regulator